VTPGWYIVEDDGARDWVYDIPTRKPEWGDDHPLRAIDEFLKAHPEFEVDEHATRTLISSAPRGFLRKRF